MGFSWKYLHESGAAMQSVDFCHESLLMSREFLPGTFLSLGEKRPLDHLVPCIKSVQTLVQELQIDNWKRVSVNRGTCQQYMNKDYASTILTTESRSFPFKKARCQISILPFPSLSQSRDGEKHPGNRVHRLAHVPFMANEPGKPGNLGSLPRLLT